MNEYPHMVYLGGDTSAEYQIVPDAGAEALAAKDGFFRAGQKPAKPSNTPESQPAPARRGRPAK